MKFKKINKNCNRIENRKSQVSIFMAVGIAIILLIATGVIVLTNIQKVDVGTGDILEGNLDQESLKRHVEECILNTKDTIKETIKNGGEFEAIESFKYNGKDYNYWCYGTSSEGCKNQIYSKIRISQTLETLLKPRVENCLNFSAYESHGYKLLLEPSTIQVKISPLNIDIYFTKAITMLRNNERIELKDFTQRINLPVGRVIDVANLILNEEIENNYFDKDNWMTEHGAEIEINKYRPYPNKLYHIMKYVPKQNEWIELNFAIEGENTNNNLKRKIVSNPDDWCVIQNECFFNPSVTRCSNITSSKPAQCNNILYDDNPICIGDSCNDCGDIDHGEEWCDYDSVTGSGLDAVGSRHYLKSCVNGKVYTEECRDYREEMCVADNNKEAMCKPNRWKSCMQQETEADCSDTSERDCYWYDTSSLFNKDKYSGDEQIKCYPQVSPGFKFWNYQGLDVCQMNNEWIDCDGVSCPQRWSDISMLQCKKLGDCGNGYSLNGLESATGYFTSDLADHPNGPSKDLLLDPTDNYDKRILRNNILEYKVDNFPSNPFECTDCTFDDILKRVKEFTEYISSLDKDDLMWEYITDGAISYHVRHFTMCLPFKMYDTGDCSSCASESKPCSEYKCNSLGSRCFYSVDDEGYGQCLEAATSNVPLNVLTSTVEINPHNNLISDTFSSEFFGFQLEDSVQEFAPIKVSFNTSKLSQCKKTRIPIPIATMPVDFDFSQDSPEPGFFIKHEFTFYPLPFEYLENEIQQLTDLQSYFELMQIEALDQKLEDIMDDIRSIDDIDTSQVEAKINAIKIMYNVEIKPKIEYFQNTFGDIISSYLFALEMKKGYVFFNCMDTEGNSATSNFYLSYNMAEDNTPPIPKQMQVLNNDLTNTELNLRIVMNEPSACRSSFVDKTYENMDYEMDCKDNLLSIDDGYECILNAPKDVRVCNPTTNKATVFVRCHDKIYETNISNTNINLNSYRTEFSATCSSY